ncbi:TPA: hypothetical protein HA249_05680 [Candidatus Woesearchaeota archaeon]|nr:hypothetical protein [Candidatus Woesearchaeota archaeon]HII89232.1 hypothetical protein [Candidatus Woesearchaeota archaeon]
MNLKDVVLERVTDTEFKKLRFPHYGKPWEDRGCHYQFARIAEAPAYDDYETLLQEFREQPRAKYAGFLNDERSKKPWTKVFVSGITEETIAEIKEGIKRNPVKKNHFELRYTRNRQRKPSDFLCIQVQFEEWDGLIVPFQVYIPPGEYGSEFSWIRSAPVVRNRYPIIALTNSRDIEVKLA